MPSLDWRTIERKLVEQGWRLEKTSQNHCRCLPPDRAKQIVHAAFGSDEPRAIRNTLSDLRKSGFRWEDTPIPPSRAEAPPTAPPHQAPGLCRDCGRGGLLGPCECPTPYQPPPQASPASALPFPAALRAARESAGLGQDAVASLMHVTRSAVEHWEGGRAVPIADHFLSLLDLFPELPEPHSEPRDMVKPGRAPGAPISEPRSCPPPEPFEVSEGLETPLPTPDEEPMSSPDPLLPTAPTVPTFDRAFVVRMIRLVVALRSTPGGLGATVSLLREADRGGMTTADLLALLVES